MSNNGNNHVIEWIKSWLSTAETNNIVDQRSGQGTKKNSVWKALELAMAFISPISTKRPTMTRIVVELKQCLKMEIARTNNCDLTESNGLYEMVSVNTELGPLAR
ncbi:LOW QUALITY PROTEIN: hypothetical protein TorRG33x02_199160 [Trema orientale]|uniref:Uncharacterized protein n=1 Tax=Trema orientale TaxID=63057 RepID=A0A2P5EFI0_TREOI|nr:LOW QUALITY PROTEIN: hypothetical protein TorRG33x02_199160 [Trema orientale]